jgi:hypothetical protein
VPLKAREVRGALTKKGFTPAEKHHHYYYFYHEGLMTGIRTSCSHNDPEISDPNCGKMARQMKLTRSQLNQFVDCKIEYKDYVKILTELGHLKKPPSS